jgi:TPR repeat protein
MTSKIQKTTLLKSLILLVALWWTAFPSFAQSSTQRLQYAQNVWNRFVQEGELLPGVEYERFAKICEEQARVPGQSSKNIALIRAQQLSLQVLSLYAKIHDGLVPANEVEYQASFRKLQSQLQSLLLAQPDLTFVYTPLGICQSLAGDPKIGADHFRKGIGLHPNWAANHGFLADNLAQHSSPTLAIEAYQQGLQTLPHNALLLTGLAQNYISTNQTNQAISLMENTLASLTAQNGLNVQQVLLAAMKQQASASYYFLLGLSHERQGSTDARNYAEAYKWYRYAQQMGFRLAGIRLADLIQRGLLRGLDNNAEAKRTRLLGEQAPTKIYVPTRFADGTRRFLVMHLNNAPDDLRKPVAQEVERFQEVFGATLAEDIQANFDQLGQSALEQNQSFTNLCRLSLDFSESPFDLTVVEVKITEPTTINYERLANRALLANNVDSLDYYLLRNAEVNYDISVNNLENSQQKLLSQIRKNPSNEAKVCYAMGLLYEKSPIETQRDMLQAVKWYIFAFNLDYRPAFLKLSNYYKTVSTSRMRLLQECADKGSLKVSVVATLESGTRQRFDIVLHEAPIDFNNPVSREIERLKLVYGATVAPEVEPGFAAIKQIAFQNGLKLTDFCKRLLELYRTNNQPQTDAELRGLQAMAPVFR